MDLYSTAELRKVIVDSRPPVQYFLDRLYKEQINFTTEEIMFDELRLGRRMAPFVAPNLQGRVLKRSGFYTKSFRPAYVKPKDVVTPGRMLRRLAGEALTGDIRGKVRWLPRASDAERDRMRSGSAASCSASAGGWPGSARGRRWCCSAPERPKARCLSPRCWSAWGRLKSSSGAGCTKIKRKRTGRTR